MSSINPDFTKDETPKKKSKVFQYPDRPGTVTRLIGSGENARDSIVFYVLWWCFALAAVLSVLVIYNAWAFRENEKVPDLMNDLQDLWKIVTPIITLALGYLFGKKGK